MLPWSRRRRRKLSLFSLLLAGPAWQRRHKRCPIKGLSAELPVLCQDFRLLSGPPGESMPSMQKHSNDPRMTVAEVDAGGRRALKSALVLAAALAPALLGAP